MKALATLQSKGIEIGNIVQYDGKGYYRVVGVVPGGNFVKLKGVLAINLTKTPNSTKTLCADWCRLVTKEELLSQLQESITLVEKVFSET